MHNEYDLIPYMDSEIYRLVFQLYIFFYVWSCCVLLCENKSNTLEYNFYDGIYE